MRRLLYILLMVTTLAGVFGLCRHTPDEAEERLIAIDSLIAIEPDSALAQLEAINADSLPADLRAYHDLLVTQAMYKAYVPASTDTLITHAWRYYADHSPYDRRIRAMLYRGTEFCNSLCRVEDPDFVHKAMQAHRRCAQLGHSKPKRKCLEEELHTDQWQINNLRNLNKPAASGHFLNLMFHF